jgi:hypothetical protein
MKTFDSFRPRSARAQARLRERELKQKLEKLLEIDDEETFRAGLEEDFGIKPDHRSTRKCSGFAVVLDSQVCALSEPGYSEVFLLL